MVKKASSLANQDLEDGSSEGEEITRNRELNSQGRARNITEVTAKRKKIVSKKNKASKNSKEDNASETEDSQIDMSAFCHIHQGAKVEFICRNWGCLQELCGHCVLEHKEHINEIQPIKNVIAQKVEKFSDARTNAIKDAVQEGRNKVFDDFQLLSERLKNIINDRIEKIRNKLLEQEMLNTNHLSALLNFKLYFMDSKNSNSEVLTHEAISLLKDALRTDERIISSFLNIEEDIIADQLERTLNQYINVASGSIGYNTTDNGVPKLLHWFEWEKRELYYFNTTTCTYSSVRLVIPFKIPPFCRSILIPDGRIFLIGGEDPENGPKREVHSISVKTLSKDQSFTARSPMPFKKYDFSLCYNDGFIYLFCGKDSDSHVTDSCERYDVAKNQWSLLSPSTKKRYAASSVVCKEYSKIYLFGGRSDNHNMMMEDIEEYDIKTNSWRVVKLQTQSQWVPVEVCSVIQIAPSKLLIFGGSDATIEDSSNSYIFNVETRVMEKTAPLKKAHVFVSPPFFQGGYVFAVGNEYYVKSRSIHRFNVEKLEWEIIF